MAFVSMALVVSGCECASAPPTEDERIRQRLDRTPVHVAVAVQEALGERRAGDEATGAFLRLARGDGSAANDAADRFFERRERGRALVERGDDRRLGSLLGAGAEHAARDRLLFATALTEVDARQARVAKMVLLYQATRLEPEALDSSLRPFARALRASIAARASACEGARPDAARALEEVETAEVGAAARALEVGVGTVEPWLAPGTRLLAHGAQACCAVRLRDDRAAATAIAALLEDARALEASEATVALLETWAAASAGDLERASEALRRAEAGPMVQEEMAKYLQLRDRLASPDPERTALVDRAWLSTTTARVLASAQEGAGLFDGEQNPGAAELHALGGALATVLATASARQPTFDVASEQGGFWSWVASVLGAERQADD